MPARSSPAPRCRCNPSSCSSRRGRAQGARQIEQAWVLLPFGLRLGLHGVQKHRRVDPPIEPAPDGVPAGCQIQRRTYRANRLHRLTSGRTGFLRPAHQRIAAERDAGREAAAIVANAEAEAKRMRENAEKELAATLKRREELAREKIAQAEAAYQAAAEFAKKSFEPNDAFPLAFSSVVLLAMWAGFNLPGMQWLVPLFVGVTVYGVVYTVIHDGVIHGRARWMKRFAELSASEGRTGIAESLSLAHRAHHRTNAEPYGMLFPQLTMRRAASVDEPQRELVTRGASAR